MNVPLGGVRGGHDDSPAVSTNCIPVSLPPLSCNPNFLLVLLHCGSPSPFWKVSCLHVESQNSSLSSPDLIIHSARPQTPCIHTARLPHPLMWNRHSAKKVQHRRLRMRAGRPVCGQERPLPRHLSEGLEETDYPFMESGEGTVFPTVGTHCSTPREEDGPVTSHCVGRITYVILAWVPGYK